MNALPLVSGPSDGDLIEHIASALADKGYIVLPASLPPGMIDALFGNFRTLDPSCFQQAGIGREDLHQRNPFVRGDTIYWLDPNDAISAEYFTWIESLRQGLNRRLFLGLFDYECHYAWYPRGGFYKKHLDAFGGDNRSRVLSTILYLNPSWSAADAGELLLYARDGDSVIERIEPQYGKLVIFLSEEFPHEVCPTQRARFSLSGWFRVNNSTAEVIDPPR